MEIDSELEEFARGLSANFPFSIGTWNGRNTTHVNVSRHIPHYDGYFYIYTSIEACNVWNNYRCTHILVNSLPLSHLKSSTNHTAISSERYPKDKYFKIQSLTKQLAIDICRSVSFKLGLAGHGKRCNQIIETVQPGAGLTLLYPFYLAAVVVDTRVQCASGLWGV